MRILTRRDTGLLTQWTFGSSSFDSDASAFIIAAGITDQTQQTAINSLVVELKGYSIWTKLNAIYPFVGGTATTHKFNLKNPADTNAAFRLVFSGGVTHGANGVSFNGTNGYADTFLTASTTLSANNNSLGYYSRTSVASSSTSAIDMGGVPDINADASLFCLIIRRNTSNQSLFAANTSSSLSIANTTVANGGGLFVGSIISSSSRKLYRNGSSIASTLTTAVQSLPAQKIYIGCISNNNVAGFFSNRECAFASIGSGLTDTESTNLYTAVQAFQTTLGRQV